MGSCVTFTSFVGVTSIDTYWSTGIGLNQLCGRHSVGC